MTSRVVVQDDTMRMLDEARMEAIIEGNNTRIRECAISGNASAEGERTYPRYHGSFEAFRWIGFSKRMSRVLADLKCVREAHYDADLFRIMEDLVRGYFVTIKGNPQVYYNHNTGGACSGLWEAALKDLGIAKCKRGVDREVCVVLMETPNNITRHGDPMSPAAWAKFLVEDRLDALRHVDSKIKHKLPAMLREMEMRRRFKRESDDFDTGLETREWLDLFVLLLCPARAVQPRHHPLPPAQRDRPAAAN